MEREEEDQSLIQSYDGENDKVEVNPEPLEHHPQFQTQDVMRDEKAIEKWKNDVSEKIRSLQEQQETLMKVKT